MNRDLIIVDDDRNYLHSLCELVRDYSSFLYGPSFNPLGFELPSEALEHIKDRSVEAIGYLIDMKPIGWVNQENIKGLSETQLSLLKAPEEIYWFIKERWGFRDKENNFYFITGELSDHDFEVIERTGAEYLIKTQIRDIETALKSILVVAIRRWDESHE